MLNEKNENKPSTEISNNPNSFISYVYPTAPPIRRINSQTVPEYPRRNLNPNSFFNPNILNQSPIDTGIAIAWRAAVIVGVACAIGPVGMGLLNAIMPSIYAAGTGFTLSAGGKFAYDQYQECTKTRKGPSSSV